jgi:hypothetical protein
MSIVAIGQLGQVYTSDSLWQEGGAARCEGRRSFYPRQDALKTKAGQFVDRSPCSTDIRQKAVFAEFKPALFRDIKGTGFLVSAQQTRVFRGTQGPSGIAEKGDEEVSLPK